MYDIVVIGAGIVGLSTAVNIQRQIPGSRVTIVADRFLHETTSDGAAGIFRVTLDLTPTKSVDRYRFVWGEGNAVICFHFRDGYC